MTKEGGWGEREREGGVEGGVERGSEGDRETEVWMEEQREVERGERRLLVTI